jgi:hypothetical protein
MEGAAGLFQNPDTIPIPDAASAIRVKFRPISLG